jgi:hypothetical protein
MRWQLKAWPFIPSRPPRRVFHNRISVLSGVDVRDMQGSRVRDGVEAGVRKILAPHIADK